MSFLAPGDNYFECPFTQKIDPESIAGLNSLVTLCIDALLCVMVTFNPYPRWSLHYAGNTAQELVHQLPVLWKTLADYVSHDVPIDFHDDHIYRRLNRLSRMATSMDSHSGNAWYECFGATSRHDLRRVLTASAKVTHESYDRVYSTYTPASSTAWCDLHISHGFSQGRSWLGQQPETANRSGFPKRLHAGTTDVFQRPRVFRG